MKTFYKILAIILCMVMSFTTFTACNFGGEINFGGGNNNQNGNTDDDDDNNGGLGGDNTDDEDDGANDDNGDDNTGDDNTGDDNTGDDNTGDDNTGDDNTGDDNTGDDNTGDDNTGDDNTGDDNTGDDNTGDDNTGDDNTGDDNTGDDNNDQGGDQTIVVEGKFTFELQEDNTYKVIEEETSSTIIEIPETVNGKPVTEIGESLFARNKNIKKVVLPQTIAIIGDNAFNGCTKIEEINLENVEVIGTNAFKGAFSNNVNVSINLGNVKTLGKNAFMSCEYLKNVDFGNAKLDVIPMEAFTSCTRLYQVVLSENITRIEKNAFIGCLCLVKINLDKVEFFGQKSFSGCANLVEISLDSARYIKYEAFAYCNELTTVYIGLELRQIFVCAFKESVKLSSVTMASGVADENGNTAETWWMCHSSANATTGTSISKPKTGYAGYAGWDYRATMNDPAAHAKRFLGNYNRGNFLLTETWMEEEGVSFNKRYDWYTFDE